MAASRTVPPIILLVSLKKEWCPFEEVHASLLKKMKSVATVYEAVGVSEGKLSLKNLRPQAICITDGGIDPKKDVNLLNLLTEYTQSGGRVVFMGCFSSFTTPPDMDLIFSSWNLPWKSGSYTRSESVLNFRALYLATSRLPAKYYAKSLFLQNVTENAKVYLPEPGSADGETAAAYESVGQGFIGYLGDVNPGDENENVVLAMCDL